MASVSTPEEEMTSVGETKSINDLPPELLVMIFADFMRTVGPRKFLSGVPAVCTLWRNLSTTPSLWDKVSLRSLYWNFDHLMKLGERGLLSSTRYLSVSTGFESGMDNETKALVFSCSKLRPFDIIKLALYCPKVKSINISSSEMSKNAMEFLTLACPHVEELIMQCVNGSNGDFDPVFQFEFQMAMSSRILDPVFSGWGKKLRHLDLYLTELSEDNELISKLAASCPSLEELHLMNTRCVGNNFFSCPVGKLQSGCPKLRVLELCNCDIVIPGDEKLVGFREMREFAEVQCNLNGFDLSLLLRNSTKLEQLRAYNCDLKNVFEIPFENLKAFSIRHEQGPTEYLSKAVRKWKYTLKEIGIGAPHGVDLASVLEAYLENNPDPILEKLSLGSFVMPLLKKVIRICRNLSFLSLWDEKSDKPMKFWNRQEIEEILGFDNPYFAWKRNR